MGAQISFDHLPARSRFQHFCDIVNSLYVPVSVTSEDPKAFRYTRNDVVLGGVTFASGMMTKMMINRTSRDVVRSESDGYMKLVLPLSGSVVFRQNKREALIKPGYFYVDDPARPYEEKVVEDLTYLSVRLPRHFIASRLDGLEAVTAVGFGPDLPHSKLASDFIISLSAVWNSLEETSAAHLGSIALDLIIAALWERNIRKVPPRSIYRSAQFQRAKAFIDAHLDDPRLSLDMVAGALYVSTRYLRYLLSERGFSFRRYALEQRLVRCAKDLADPSLAHRSVTTIAYSWAFSDGAHFSRSFRAAFGMPPREYRASKLTIMPAG
jgi:AraC-like DNA-binding protein